MTAAVLVDAAGARMGGAARYLAELHRYLRRTGRDDVRVVGSQRRLDPAWLTLREFLGRGCAKRVALNNVGFVGPGGERWTLLRNALHFLSETEQSSLDPSLRTHIRREAAVVRRVARLSQTLVAPSTAMAERIARSLPDVRERIVVRPHPVSADSIPRRPREAAILCPVLFAPYKRMARWLVELLTVLDEYGDPAIRLWVTADESEVPAAVVRHPRVELVGRRTHGELRELHARSRASFFPTDLESFGWPLAEARVSGQPVIAQDTPHNREIGGPALCGFTPGDPASLARALATALTTTPEPDPAPFDPEAYFGWLLGVPR